MDLRAFAERIKKHGARGHLLSKVLNKREKTYEERVAEANRLWSQVKQYVLPAQELLKWALQFDPEAGATAEAEKKLAEAEAILARLPKVPERPNPMMAGYISELQRIQGQASSAISELKVRLQRAREVAKMIEQARAEQEAMINAIAQRSAQMVMANTQQGSMRSSLVPKPTPAPPPPRPRPMPAPPVPIQPPKQGGFDPMMMTILAGALIAVIILARR